MEHETTDILDQAHLLAITHPHSGFPPSGFAFWVLLALNYIRQP